MLTDVIYGVNALFLLLLLFLCVKVLVSQHLPTKSSIHRPRPCPMNITPLALALRPTTPLLATTGT
jgi:hypothetical protein